MKQCWENPVDVDGAFRDVADVGSVVAWPWVRLVVAPLECHDLDSVMDASNDP